MIRSLRLFGSLLVVLALLVACGDEDNTESGADTQVATATAVMVSPEATPSAEATPTEPEATPTAAVEPATPAVEPATPTVDATATPSKDVEATPPSTEASGLTYERLTAWDAKWEGLGAMMLGPDGRLYIDDHVRDQVMVYEPDGSEHPPLPYESDLPEMVELRNDLSVGQDGRIYLLEQSGTAKVKVYEPDGLMVSEWGGTVGFDEESLFEARTIAVASDGHIFTTRPGLLQKFTNEGEFVAAWDRAGEDLFPAEVWDMDIFDDRLFIAGTGYRDDQNVILTFDQDGNLISDPLVVGESDAQDRIFPASLAIGPDGNLFIFDPFRREMIVLTTSGSEVARWPLEPTDERFPVAEVAVDADGLVYVADGANKAVFVYAPSDGDAAAVQPERTLSIIPAHAPCSTPVDVIGKGFEPGAAVALIETWQDGGSTLLAEVVAGSDGVVTAEVAPQAGQDCFAITELAGIPVSIDAQVAGETVASTNFTVYSMNFRAGLRLSADAMTCDDVLTVSGLNFAPGTNAIVTVGVEGGHQPVVPGEAVPVAADGSFEATIDISQFGPCLAESFAEPQEYIVWAATDRAKQESAPTSYPSQRATITLLPPVE